MAEKDEKLDASSAEKIEDASHVVEGEVVQPEDANAKSTAAIDEKIKRGRAYSKSKKSGYEAHVSEDIAALARGSRRARFGRFLLWFATVSGLLAAVYYTRPNLDWQVEHINRLQAEVAQLKQVQDVLTTQLEEQKGEMAEQVNSVVAAQLNLPENQAMLTKADLNEVQTFADTQIEALKAELSSLSTAVAEGMTKTVEKVQEVTPDLNEALSEQQRHAVAEMERKLQQELAQLKAHWQAWSTSNKTDQAVSADPATVSLNALQEWVLAVNTQWLVKGDVNHTEQQLMALEAVASAKPAAKGLLRFIGQDLTYLTQYQQQKEAHSLPASSALREAIMRLNARLAEEPVSTNAAAVTTEESIENRSFDSALTELKARFSDLIRVQKRDDEAETTAVEQLLLKDVLIQRALLYVDQIEWAIESESPTLLQQSIARLDVFIAKHFAQQHDEVALLLAPYRQWKAVQRQTLKIVLFVADKQTLVAPK